MVDAVRVAVVFYGLSPEGGGAFTFQESLLETVAELAPLSDHEFVYYSGGSPYEGTMPVIRIPAGRGARWTRRSIQVTRGVRDWLAAPRSARQTWFERSLEEHDVEFVWFASHYAEDCDQPFLYTLWDLAHLQIPWFPEIGAAGEWERRHQQFEHILPRAAMIAVPNQAGEDLLVNSYPVGRERVLQLPLPTPAFALEPPAADIGKQHAAVERLGVREPFLLYPAQFWGHKNHVTALRALAELNHGSGPRRSLVFVGSDKGELQHVRATAVRLGVADDVGFLGFVPTRDLVALYTRADALLYTSLLGPENLPPLEANALGCPVVCADTFGMREQLGDAALFFAPTNAAAAAAAVHQLADPAVRERLVDAGRALASGRTQRGYVEAIFAALDAFAPVRECWS